MENENIEKKLHRLEDLLQKWHEENLHKEKQSFEKIKKLLISTCCVLVGAVGAIWSFVELSDWYFKQAAISEMAENYIFLANENYARTRDVHAAVNMTAKAVELTPDDPDVRFQHVYYRSQKTYQNLLQISRPLTGEEISGVNETISEIAILKKLTPDRYEPYMLEATLYYRLKQTAKAEAAIKTAVSKEKEFIPEIRYWYFMIMYDLAKNIGECEKIIAELQAKKPEDKWALLTVARWSNYTNRYTDAVKLCKKAIEKDPDFYEAYFLLAWASSNVKDYKQGIFACKKAISLRPMACAPAYCHLARNMRHYGYYSSALAYAENGIKLFPDYIGLHLEKIQIQIDMKKYDSLSREIAHVMNMAPDSRLAYQYNVDIYLAQGKFREAVQAVTRFREYLDLTEGDNSLGYNNLAWRFYLLGSDYKTAAECANKATTGIGSRRASRFDTKASILSRLGDKKALLETMEKTIAVCVNDVERAKYSNFQVSMLLNVNMPEKALEKIKYAEKLNPGTEESLRAQAEYYIYVKDLNQAEKVLKKLDKKSKNVRARSRYNYLLAKYYAAHKNYEAARTCMASAAQHLNNGFLEIQPFCFTYAEYLIKCGRVQEARETLEKIQPICCDIPRYNSMMQEIRGAEKRL